jgi:tight adherence protein B
VEGHVIYVVLTFVIFFAGIYSAYYMFVVRPEQIDAGVVRRRLRAGRKVGATPQSKLRKQMQTFSALGPLDSALRRSSLRTQGLQQLIDQSGARLTLGSLVLATGTVALLAFVVVQRLLEAPIQSSGISTVVGTVAALAAAVLAAWIPVAVLKFMRTRRLRKFEEQFPEALDLLSRAMRAGHAFTTGMEMVASEMPQPVGPEFRLLHDQQNYGMPLQDALRVFADRVPLLDARFFVTAVLIQRESGGNLAEVLDNLTKVIRERFRVKRQMRVISAHGRITGWILVALPPVLGIALMTANPEHRRTMFGDPLGIQMIVGAIVLQIIGTLIIKKIINVEY